MTPRPFLMLPILSGVSGQSTEAERSYRIADLTLETMFFRNPFRNGRRESNRPAEGYSVFTRAHDLAIDARQLESELGQEGWREWRTAVRAYWNKWGPFCEDLDRASAERAENQRQSIGASVLDETVACLLVDHSGSMKGQKAEIAGTVANAIIEHWSRLAIRFEVLGFTTRSWHGGMSHKEWNRRGKPEYPGRLCDLLHVVYKSADEEPVSGPVVGEYLLRDELLRENVDGEALEWAAGRLQAQPESRKRIVIVSDGAPVDDSTLLENHDLVLLDHLQAVAGRLERDTRFHLAGIGIDYDISQPYRQTLCLRAMEDVDEGLIDFAGEVLR